MEQGTVSRFDEDKRYGFINDGRGGSIFFHLNDRAWGKDHPSRGETLLFERDIDSQGRSRAKKWLPASDIVGLVDIRGCFLAPEVLSRYPFLHSIFDIHSKKSMYWGIYPVTAKSLALELPTLKAWHPEDNVSNICSRKDYVYAIARGKQPVELRKGQFILDDIIQPGPSVAEELARLGYRDSDISAIVRIEEKDGHRDKRLYPVIVYS